MEEDKNKNPKKKVISPNIHFNAPVGNVNYMSTVTYVLDNQDNKKREEVKQNATNLDKAHLREEILEYVGRIYDFYTSKWQLHYIELWNDILDMPVVDLNVYKIGRQQATHFNRNLVGRIIGYLSSFNLYKESIVPGTFTHQLAKNGKGKSVRGAMGDKLEPEICEAIKLLMASKKYF